MANKAFVRVWQEMDTKEIEPRLLIWGKISGDCANCKEVGVSLDAITCPKCGAAFKYASIRPSGSTKEAKRLKAKRPDLTIIEFADYKEAQARTKAHGLLGE